MNIKTISGGYQVPDDECLGKFQIESDRLDHDRHLVPIACECIKPGMVVLDGGSFNGDHAIAYRRAAGRLGAVICVEANPFTFGLLEINMAIQDKEEGASVCGRILSALGSSDGYLDGHLVESLNLGASHIIHSSNPDFPVTTIDVLRKTFGHPLDFIKLDIEGFEYEALKGGLECLRESRPTLMIEMCNETLKRRDANTKMIYDLLESHGYKWEILQPQLNADSPQYDILATPK